MSLSKLIVFPAPLASVRASVRSRTRTITEEELEALVESSHESGAEQARQLANRQLVDFRSDVQQVQESLFASLENASTNLAKQVHEALPQLATAIAKRLLHGWEPPPELVEKICHDSLNELFPETNALELVVSRRAAVILEKSNPSWMRDFPNLTITVDPSFELGDCIVRSRFGTVDARLSTRLQSLQESIARG